MSLEDEEARLADTLRRRKRAEDDLARIERMRDELLSIVEMQSVLSVLLKRARERNWLKPADRVEIANAVGTFKQGDYSPGAKIRRTIQETLLDAEDKRQTPGR